MKNKEEIKRYPEIAPVHRTDFPERNKKTKQKFLDGVVEFTKCPDMIILLDC